MSVRTDIVYVNVLWSHQSEREATWELEFRMHERYPDLFTAGTCFTIVKF